MTISVTSTPNFVQFLFELLTLNSYLLLAFLQSGSAPELDMHESKHFLPGQFVHSAYIIGKNYNLFALIAKQAGKAYLNLYKFI
jgi:hypothetical protein